MALKFPRLLLVAGLVMAAVLLARLSLVVQASPAFQLPQYSTSTPGPDGRILYIVQAGDSCFRVAALHGISVEQLRALNSNLNADCILVPNQPLVVGVGGPSGGEPTAGPTPTEVFVGPTPTPFAGNAEVCVVLFNDINGDSLRQEVELTLPGGVISLVENAGRFSQSQDTLPTTDPADIPEVCFPEVPEGTYTVSAAIPDEFNPTTALTYSFPVKPGDQAFVAFGAQPKNSGPDESDAGGRSSALGLLGLVLLLAGGGLAFYARRLRSASRKLRY